MLTSANAQTKNIAGTWEGTLNAGVPIQLVFNFTTTGANKFSGTMDSPSQHAKDIALTSVVLEGDTLTVELKPAHAVYKAVRTGDSAFSGTWQQGPASLPLVIKHVEHATVAAEPKRPQTPMPPFMYNSEDVEYDNADKSIRFGATYTYPKTGGPFATIILITGSGAQDRDETILGHKPFAVLADYLTKRGYAVLRIDDRGMGKTTGSMINATSADFAKDVEAAIAYVKARPETDKNKIGLTGHSEGGVIAPMVASVNKDIDFIILSGAPLAGGAIINTEQNGLALQKAGFSKATVDAFKQLHLKELGLFGEAQNTVALNKGLKEVFDQWRIQQPDSVLKSLAVTDSTIIGRSINSLYDGLYNLHWMRFFIAHDFAADLAKVHCKVLAINGGLDTQVGATTNLAVINAVLKKNHVKLYTVIPLKGLNHLLQTAVTGDVSEYSKIEETIAPLALETIGNWLDTNVKSGKK
jgi:pimeloyl-ACP methyl ester carboxylesterase